MAKRKAKKAPNPVIIQWHPNVKCDCGHSVAEFSDGSTRCAGCGFVFRGKQVKIQHASRILVKKIITKRPNGSLTYTIVRATRYANRKFQRQLTRRGDVVRAVATAVMGM